MTIIMIIVNLGWSEIRKQNQSVLVPVIWFVAPSLAGVIFIIIIIIIMVMIIMVMSCHAMISDHHH